MAVRLNRRHTDLVLARIQTSQLVTRLQKHSLGMLKNDKDEVVHMTDSQVRAACFLIERTLAKAEAPRKLDVSGTLTLERLITGAVDEPEHERLPASH